MSDIGHKKQISLFNSILLMFGNMVGVGIFLYPSLIANRLSHPIYFFIFWVIGGLIAISGALSSSILAINKPETGGDYAYLRNSYGSKISFIYGLLAMMITFPASIAIGLNLSLHIQGSTIFGAWLNQIHFVFPLIGEVYYFQSIAVFIIIFLTIINIFGIEKSLFLQKFTTLLPILLLVFIFILMYIITFFYKTATLSQNLNIPFQSLDLFSSGTALVAVYWTYTGWNAPLSLGDEIKDAKKIIPLAMIFGPSLVMILYLFFTILFVSSFSYSTLQNESNDIFYILMNQNFSFISPKFLSAIIFLIVIGNINSALITGSRILFAMSKDKLFFQHISHLNKFHSPQNALIYLCIFSIFLILVLNKESQILNLAFIPLSLLSILTILSVYKINHIPKRKNFYYYISYKISPIIYSISTILILILVIIDYIQKKDFTILFSSIGIFIFAFFISHFKEVASK